MSTKSNPIQGVPASSERVVIDALEPRRLFANGTLPGVPEVVGQFKSLQTHAEGLAYTLNESKGAPDASVLQHYQGLARYPGTGTPVFYVTQKNESSGGYIHVVSMGSRGTDGERLRSNLRVTGVQTSSAAPPASDTWVRSIHLNGNSVTVPTTLGTEKLASYIHPGGVAVVDNILFVAMDTRRTLGAGGTGAIVLFDLGTNGENKLNPKPIRILPLNHVIDNLAVVKDGSNYLVWTNGGGGSALHVYRTSGLNLRDKKITLNHVQTWSPTPANLLDNLSVTGTARWPSGASAYQSSTFIRQSASGTPSDAAPLYMIATFHTGGPLDAPLVGNDYADLYKVTVSSSGIKLTRVATYHPTLRYDGGGTLGNFAAASGAYVSPTGELLLYTAPHNDEDGFAIDNVRIGELRHKNVVRPGSPFNTLTLKTGGPYTVPEGGSVTLNAARSSLVGPWVELFDDDNFGDRSIMIDYTERSKMALNNFDNLDGFGDKTTSVRWMLPVGMKAVLYQDKNYGGGTRTLTGTGKVEQIADLGNFSDDPSSIKFFGTPPTDAPLTWDLDGDGIFGETGTAARHGNETGLNPIFKPNSSDDGPKSVPIAVRAVNNSGNSVTATGIVSITNAAPTVSIAGSGNAVQNQPIRFTLSATDPPSADFAAGFTYKVLWGDGTSSTFTPPATNRSAPVIATHTYTRRGTFTMAVTATDKNGGVSPAKTVAVRVDFTLPPTPVFAAKSAAVFGSKPLVKDLLED